MILVDSSAWIELFTRGDLSKPVQREIARSKRILVPTVVLFEVYRKLLRSMGESEGLVAVSTLSQYEVVDLTRDIALLAADISSQEDLAMADSLILASARTFRAKVITLDNDFTSFPDAKVLRK
jgi:predicted nucleic acid-binding protein